MTPLPELVRAERLEFVALLESLRPEEWGVRTLCTAWTVQELAGHLAAAPVARPGDVLAGLVRAGFRLNAASVEQGRAHARRGPVALLAELRAHAESGVRPAGVPAEAALIETVLHAIDVRVPLDRPRPLPPEVFTRVASQALGTRGPLTLVIGGSPRKRVRGVRLVATDQDWSHGDGPEVRGPGEALLRLLMGRPWDGLTGPGAARLTAERV